VTEVRNLVAPGWARERISRRRVGRGSDDDAGEDWGWEEVAAGVMARLSGTGKGTADEVGGGGGEDAGEVGDMKIWWGLGTGVVDGIIVIEIVPSQVDDEWSYIYMVLMGGERDLDWQFLCTVHVPWPALFWRDRLTASRPRASRGPLRGTTSSTVLAGKGYLVGYAGIML